MPKITFIQSRQASEGHGTQSSWIVDNGRATYLHSSPSLPRSLISGFSIPAANADDLIAAIKADVPPPIIDTPPSDSSDWARERDAAYRLRNDGPSSLSECHPHQGHTILESHETALNLGEYFPRVFRTVSFDLFPNQDKQEPPFDEEGAAESARTLHMLGQDLNRVFENIYPDKANLAAYGDRARNVLLICAIEVERQFKGILAANHVAGDHTMTTYKKLEQYLMLGDTKLQLSSARLLGSRTPFAGFAPGASAPPWWKAYTKTKHDKDARFVEASLENAVDAYCGLAALHLAQFGREEHGGRLLVDTFSRIEVHQHAEAECYFSDGKPWRQAKMVI